MTLTFVNWWILYQWQSLKKILYRLFWTAQHASHQGSCLCFLSTSRSQLVFQLKFTESTCAKIAKHFAARNFFCTSFDWSQLLNDTIDFSNDWIPPPVPILKHFWVIKGINSESAKVHWSRSPKVNFLDSALQCHSDKVLVADVPCSLLASFGETNNNAPWHPSQVVKPLIVQAELFLAYWHLQGSSWLGEAWFL